MPDKDTTFRYIGLAAIVLLLLGLAGWYFFISRQTRNIEDVALARGFDISVPSFSGSRGSTSENIQAGFGMRLEEIGTSTVAEEERPRPPRLWRVNTTPVAGMGFVTNGSTTVLRYVERSTGHIFDANPDDGAIVRRTNRLIPKVYEALVSADDAVIARTIEEDRVVTFAGELGTTTEDGFVPFTGTDLGDGISSIAFANNMTVFVAERAGTIGLIRSEIDGSKPQGLLSLGVSSFNVLPLTDNRIVLVERSASGVPGHAYEVKNGALESLARNIPGLTLLPRANSNALLIGSDTGRTLSLAIRPSKEGTTLPLQLATVADKCVWAPGLGLTAYCAVPQALPSPGFLTNWLRGKAHTSDSWFIVNGGAGTSESFYSMSADDALDVERPVMDEQGEYIAFMSMRDKSLWILRINE